MNIHITFTLEAYENLKYWENNDKKTLKKIHSLITDITRNGNTGTGKPEPLLGNLQGYWSRRIDEKNRLIYFIKDDSVVIVSCKGHYGDK